MEKQIAVCIGTDINGGVRVRLSLLLMDGDNLIHEHYHAAMLLPGDDPAELRRILETALARPDAPAGGSWPAIPDAEWSKVTTVLAAFHTPDKIEKRKAREAKN